MERMFSTPSIMAILGEGGVSWRVAETLAEIRLPCFQSVGKKKCFLVSVLSGTLVACCAAHGVLAVLR